MNRSPAAPSVVPWKLRSVVFDLDGLMVDTEPIFVETARQLLARRGRELLPEIMARMMGMPARDALPFFRQGHQLADSVEDLAAESRALFFAILGQEAAPLLPGVRGLLERLKCRGVPRAIATSSSAAYVQRILTPHQLLDQFDFILTCEDVTQGKPFPEVYQKAAARFGHAPDEMVVLEDSPNGLRAAKAAGARCVVVPHPLVPRQELAGADAILESLEEPRLAELLGL